MFPHWVWRRLAIRPFLCIITWLLIFPMHQTSTVASVFLLPQLLLFFLYLFQPLRGTKGVHLANHNLISVRLRKYWLIILEYCTFLTSACSFNIGLALLLGIRSLDPRPRARTAPALAWCRRQLGSQTSCSAKSRSQFWSLTFNDKHWNVWWNLAS